MSKNSTRGFSYSVVLATYKEYPNLKKLLPQLCTLLKKFSKAFEILVVDDNSQDGTVELITELQHQKNPIRLLVRTKQRGLASALIRGTKLARFDHIIRLDADFSHHPTDLSKMLQFYQQTTNPQVVVGSRFVKGSVYLGKPLINQLASLTARTICRFLFRIPVIDLSNDFRIFPAKSWRAISKHLSINGNAVLIQEIILFHKMGLRITEIPTTFEERTVGNSKLVLLNEIKRFYTAFPILFGDSLK